MIIQENLKILLINNDNHFKETEFQNPDGLPITIPARSIMWSDYNDDNGHPVYEFGALDYIRPVDKGEGLYDLESTPALDQKNAAKQNKKAVSSDLQSRVFHIVLKRRDSITGEIFEYPFDEQTYIDKLSNDKVSYQYGIATHNCDLYQEEDEKKEIRMLTERYRSSGSTDEGGLEDYLSLQRKIFKGNQKPRHIHIAIRNEKTDSKGGHTNMRLPSLAKKLGLPEFCFQKKHDNTQKGGTDGFIDAIRYLTHDTVEAVENGKYQYPDDIRTVNFDWKTEYETILHEREKYGSHNMTPAKKMQYAVLFEGKTLQQCEDEDPVLYMENIDKLKKLRLEYITRQDPPIHRVNFYLYGKGGAGKDLMSRALARSLFPQYKNDREIFFVVGGDKVPFDGYDGQPVLIWSDRRAAGLIRALGSRENCFNIFETHPTSQRQNVKFGSVNLCNLVNIVNGQEPWWTFLDGMSGKYKDKDGVDHDAEDTNQSYRRFPFIIPIHDQDFDMMVNKGYIDNDTSLFHEYYEYMGFIGNFQQMAIRCGGENSLYKNASGKVLKPVTAKYDEICKKNAQLSPKEEEIDKWLEEQGYGKQRNSVNGNLIVTQSDFDYDLYQTYEDICDEISVATGKDNDFVWKEQTENVSFRYDPDRHAFPEDIYPDWEDDDSIMNIPE